MISSSWAAARTHRQLPQLSSITIACNGLAKLWRRGALHNLEPFKANHPTGMSLSLGVRLSDRGRRDDHMALLGLPRAGWVCTPQIGAPGSPRRGAVLAGGACGQGKELSLQKE